MEMPAEDAGHSGARRRVHPSLRDMEEADAVLVLGEDVTQTAARIALALRQAVKGKGREIARKLKVDLWQVAAVQTLAQNQRYPCSSPVWMPPAWMTWRAAPCTPPRGSGAPRVCHRPPAGRQCTGANGSLPRTAGPRRPMGRPAWQRQKPLIIAGNGARNEALIEAASNIARALKGPWPGRGACPGGSGSQQPGAGHAGPACRPAGGSPRAHGRGREACPGRS